MLIGFAPDEDTHIQHHLWSSIWDRATNPKRETRGQIPGGNKRNLVSPPQLAFHKLQPQSPSKFRGPKHDKGISEKREELEKGASPHQDLITCLLSIRGE